MLYNFTIPIICFFCPPDTLHRKDRMIEPVAQEAVAAGIPISGGPSSR